jgi:prophage regulatory protein
MREALAPLAIPEMADEPAAKGHFMTQDHIITMYTQDRFLRIDAVLHRTGLSRATLYRKVQQGTFPKQIRIAERCVGWRESAINDWQRNPFQRAGISRKRERRDAASALP